MPFEVRLSEPPLLDELMSAFLRNGCLAQRVAADSCVVIHVHASDDREARRELGFFVRSWQLRHPSVSASLSYERV